MSWRTDAALTAITNQNSTYVYYALYCTGTVQSMKGELLQLHLSPMLLFYFIHEPTNIYSRQRHEKLHKTHNH